MRSTIYTIFSALLLVCCFNVSAVEDTDDLEEKEAVPLPDFRSGLNAYKKNDLPTAIMIWSSLAEQGDPQSQFMMGNLYMDQDGLAKNPEKTVYWYTKAAEQDHIASQSRLGLMYLHGDGIPRDGKKAIKWLLKASRTQKKKSPLRRRSGRRRRASNL